MRILAALFLVFFSTMAQAAVLVVNVYQPLAGKGPLTASYMREAQSIIEGMGHQAGYTMDLSGVYRFTMYFEDMESYGEMFQQLGSSPAWAAFTAKISASPSATQIDNLLLNEVKAGPAAQPGQVTESTLWEAPLSQRNAFIQAAMGAVPHHERQGAAGVSIWADAFHVYYVTHHEDMQAFGKFRDTPNPEFQQYFAAQQNPDVIMLRQTVMVRGQ